MMIRLKVLEDLSILMGSTPFVTWNRKNVHVHNSNWESFI